MAHNYHAPTEATESPPKAPGREVAALLDLYLAEATRAELGWLRHQLERGLEARARRVEDRAA
jgi:hypothetical protein